jgi:putative transposase
VVTTAQRRAVVTEARARCGLSLSRACRYLGVHRALVRYVPQRVPPAGLCARLRRDGWLVNHKRIERLVREEHLLVGQRPRRKRVAQTRVPSPVPTRPDQRWSMDFVRDTLADGRPLRVWALVDDATREAPLVLVDRSLPAARVVEALDTLLLVRGRSSATTGRSL